MMNSLFFLANKTTLQHNHLKVKISREEIEKIIRIERT